MPKTLISVPKIEEKRKEKKREIRLKEKSKETWVQTL